MMHHCYKAETSGTLPTADILFIRRGRIAIGTCTIPILVVPGDSGGGGGFGGLGGGAGGLGGLGGGGGGGLGAAGQTRSYAQLPLPPSPPDRLGEPPIVWPGLPKIFILPPPPRASNLRRLLFVESMPLIFMIFVINSNLFNFKLLPRNDKVGIWRNNTVLQSSPHAPSGLWATERPNRRAKTSACRRCRTSPP